MEEKQPPPQDVYYLEEEPQPIELPRFTQRPGPTHPTSWRKPK